MGMNFWIALFTVVLLGALATIIKYLGGEILIAGYNTSSAAARKYMKEKGIGAFVGNYIYLLAAIIVAGYLLSRAGFIWGQDVAWGFFIAVIIIMLVRVQRFNPPPELSEGKSDKSQKTITVIALVLSVVIVVGVMGNLYWSSRPAQYTFTDTAMRISGAYGTIVNYTAIDTVRLEAKLPIIGYKNNGLNMGPVLKGHFQVEKWGQCLLFLRSAEGPVIIITRRDKREPVLINLHEPAQTRNLYQKTKNRVD